MTDLVLLRRLPHYGAPVVGVQRAALDRRGGLPLLPARPDLPAIAALHRPAAPYLGQQPAPAHPLVHAAGQLGRRLDTLHVAAPDGPQLEVDGEHDEAGQQEGDAGRADRVGGSEVKPAGAVLVAKRTGKGTIAFLPT